MTTKRITIGFLLLSISLAVLFITGCGTREQEREHLLIAATIYPYELILNDLITDNTVVKSIIPASASPHTFSPKPEDIKLLENADLVVSNGAGLENYFEDVLRDLEDKHIEAFHIVRGNLDEYLDEIIDDKKYPHQSEKENHGHSPSGVNPHFWLDPLNAMTIASGIAEALIVIDPENEELYRKNLEQLRKNLNQLNTEIMLARATLDNVSVLNFHDAFYYFNRRYSIHSAGVIVRSPGKEPTAAELVEAGKQITENDVRAIFIEPQLNPKAAEIIAKEFRLTVIEVDPIGTEETAGSIVDLIEYNWNAMKTIYE